MGTRNLTMVVMDQQTKIAQYGQWDGRPSGQGLTVLEFMRAVNSKKFKDILKKVRFQTDEDKEEVDQFLESIGSKDGWMTEEQAKLYRKRYPYFTRDHGAEILNLVYESKDKEIVLVNAENFAADGLFCEWAYVIDLDKNALEVYAGFNEAPVKEGDRFYHLTEKGKEYGPVGLVRSYSLDELPSDDTFVTECDPPEDEE